jgi:penicillin-binding protein 1A
MSSPNAPAKRSRLRGCLWRLTVWTAILGLIAALAGGTTLFFVLDHFGQDLPDIRNVHDYRPRQTSRMYAADGQLVAELIGDDAIRRTVIPSADIPEVMRQAIVAAEDQHFYEHAGLDWIGLTRAVLTNLRRREMSQGASTITQQLVKNLVLSPERSLRRKIQEAMLAFEMERHLSKDEILTIYLNHIFFGSQYYGIEEASQYYFGHPARELNLTEAAMLAGLPQSPNAYNPHRHPERATERRGYVLRRMYEGGDITESVYREALEAPLGLRDPSDTPPWLNQFPDYTDGVIRFLLDNEIVDESELMGGGVRVETALNIELQLAATNAVESGLRAFDERHGYLRPASTIEPEAIDEYRADHAADARDGLDANNEYRAVIISSDEESTVVAIGHIECVLRREPVSRHLSEGQTWTDVFPVGAVFTVVPTRTMSLEQLTALGADERPEVHLVAPAQAALVAIEPDTREVLAVVGGYEVQRGGFNRGLQASRQVGSTFKAFVYAAAIEARVITPATVYQDQPFTVRMPGQPDWRPANYDGEYLGAMSAREALARSRNVIAVRVLEQLGLSAMHDFAGRIGSESELTDNLTLALGSAEMTPLELANMFATFAAGGMVDEPRLVRRVLNGQGEILWESAASPERVVAPDVNYLATSMLESVVTSGTGAAARRLGHPLAGKTGTTNGARDAWFAGFSRHLAVAVWVGRDNNEPLGRRESGGRAALPIWVDFMESALEGVEPEPLSERPEIGLVDVLVDAATGLRARADQESAGSEVFLLGTEPQSFAPPVGEQTTENALFRGEQEAAGGSGTLDEF